MSIGVATMEESMAVPQKLKIELPYDPAIPLLGMYLKKTKKHYAKKKSAPTLPHLIK